MIKGWRSTCFALLCFLLCLWFTAAISQSEAGGADDPRHPFLEKQSCCKIDGAPPVATATIYARGEKIQLTEDSFRPIRAKLFELENQIYEMKKNCIDDVLFQQLLQFLSKDTSRSERDLYEEQVVKKSEVSLVERDKFFAENLSQVGWWQRFRLRASVEQYLQKQKTAQKRALLFRQLQARYKVDIVYGFRPPAVEDLSLPGGVGEPFLGNSLNPEIRLVVFTDYRCPHCKEAVNCLRRLVAAHGDKVVIHFKDFPISTDPVSIDAAIAGRFAFRNGDFFTMQSLLFENQARLDRKRILSLAKSCGLATDVLDKELQDATRREEVQNNLKEGIALGVKSTPTIFIGGLQVIAGSQPLDVYERAISAFIAARMAAGTCQ